MTKKLIKVEMERDSLQQKWGITIQVKVDDASKAKTWKYLICRWVNLKGVHENFYTIT